MTLDKAKRHQQLMQPKKVKQILSITIIMHTVWMKSFSEMEEFKVSYSYLRFADNSLQLEYLRKKPCD